MISTTRLPTIFRFFGPVEPAEVSDLIEDTLNDPSDKRLEDTLRRFALGEIEPRELAYEIQIIMESNYNRRKSAEPEGLEEECWEGA